MQSSQHFLSDHYSLVHFMGDTKGVMRNIP